MLTRNVLLYGRDEPLPQVTELRAGPLSLIYENGDLRTIRLGTREVLRRVYVAVRDRNWGTVAAKISNERIEKKPDSFRIGYEATHQQDDIDFFWHGTIRGERDGTIHFSMEGVARSTFLRNRIGFCVLHPAVCAGARCRVQSVHGTVQEAEFPRCIQPHAPFLDIASIAHEVQPNVWAQVLLRGDVFEMEDQRNWIDASFKTFCTPLRRPFPVEIQSGTTISQSVTLQWEGVVPADEAQTNPLEFAPLQFSVGARRIGRVPPVGIGIVSHSAPLSELELERLRALHLSHLRVDLHLSQPKYSQPKYFEELQRATCQARALGIRLEAALFVTNNAQAELEGLLTHLAEIEPAVGWWLIFHEEEKSTTSVWVDKARACLARYDAAIPMGAGTNAYFTELNRGRPDCKRLDFVAYSVNPQVHAFDNLSLIESLEALPITVDSARQFCGDASIVISPITLKPRFNPDATGPAALLIEGQLPAEVDVRQMSLFGAGWTLGALANLARSDVARLTFYETSGWHGVMETMAGSPPPFPHLPGYVFPLFHVLADVNEWAGASVSEGVSSDRLRLCGVVLNRDGQTRVLLANHTPVDQSIEISGLDAPLQLRVLDETNVLEAMRSPAEFRRRDAQLVSGSDRCVVHLRAYAVARIDSERHVVTGL